MGQYSEGGRVVVWDQEDYDNAIPGSELVSAELASLIATGGHSATVTVGDIIEGLVIGVAIGLNASWGMDMQIHDTTIAAGVDANGWASVYSSAGTTPTVAGSTLHNTPQFFPLGQRHIQSFPFLVMPRMRFRFWGDIDPGSQLVSISAVISRPMVL